MQTLECLFTWQNNVAKIRPQVECHLFTIINILYVNNSNAWKLEQQHNKHVHLKKSYQRMKVIGHIADNFTKLSYVLMSDWI